MLVIVSRRYVLFCFFLSFSGLSWTWTRLKFTGTFDRLRNTIWDSSFLALPNT